MDKGKASLQEVMSHEQGCWHPVLVPAMELKTVLGSMIISHPENYDCWPRVTLEVGFEEEITIPFYKQRNDTEKSV